MKLSKVKPGGHIKMKNDRGGRSSWVWKVVAVERGTVVIMHDKVVRRLDWQELPFWVKAVKPVAVEPIYGYAA
jgi:hypothetical protein